MADKDTEVYVYFTVTTEHKWSGAISELPPAVRKGILTGRGEDKELDEDKFQENLTDEVLEKLAKKCGVDSQEYSIDEVGEE